MQAVSLPTCLTKPKSIEKTVKWSRKCTISLARCLEALQVEVAALEVCQCQDHQVNPLVGVVVAFQVFQAFQVQVAALEVTPLVLVVVAFQVCQAFQVEVAALEVPPLVAVAFQVSQASQVAGDHPSYD